MNLYLKKPFGSAQGKQQLKWQKAVIGLVLLAAFIGFLTIFQSPIKNSFYVITSPLLKPFWQAGESTSGFFSPLFNTKGLAQENSNLKQENQNLLSQVISLQDTVQADQSIKEVIQNTQADNFSLSLAQIIGLDSANDMILINKGSSNGIKENMPVISSTKVLFGRVFKVYKNFSQVMLISHKQSVVDAKIQPSDITVAPVLGAIKGNGNLLIYLDLVSLQAKISPGDVLFTSGQEGVFPKDLLIGKVQTSSKNDLQPFQTAKVQPLFDLNTAQNLFIITNYK